MENFRDTFCTRLCENETNLKVIQSIMGHKDIQTTMDIYADCTDEKKKEVLSTVRPDPFQKPFFEFDAPFTTLHHTGLLR